LVELNASKSDKSEEINAMKLILGLLRQHKSNSQMGMLEAFGSLLQDGEEE
jgi:hypothetical protein